MNLLENWWHDEFPPNNDHHNNNNNAQYNRKINGELNAVPTSASIHQSDIIGDGVSNINGMTSITNTNTASIFIQVTQQYPQILTTSASATYLTNNNDDNHNNQTIIINNILNTYQDLDTNWINSSSSVLLLILVYGVIVLGGVLGNASLVITLYSASSIRLRNPLLVALCLADLLVAGVSAPTTIVTLALTHKPWTLPVLGCKLIYYMQSMPVAASTFSFLMLSLDRYATVKHPSMAQLRQRRYVHAIFAVLSWIGAIVICIPILLAYKITNITPANNQAAPFNDIVAILQELTTSTTTTTSSSSSSVISDGGGGGGGVGGGNQHYQPASYSICRANYGSNKLQTSFILIHTVVVFIVPGVGVVLNHCGVRKKLCALSLTARAAHGELPLPMPILRRPTHMIIVTGMANAAARHVVSDSNSSENDDANVDVDDTNNGPNRAGKSLMMDTIVRTAGPKSPRVMREIRVHQQRQKLEAPPPGLPLPQTSTLRARRRLANMLVGAAIIFIGCWTPHVICVLWTEFGEQEYCSDTVSYFSLLLGYTHSVISPIIYWILNHNSLRQSPCAPFMRFCTVERFMRNHWRSAAAPPPPPSSTNEAALGAFNPRYIKATPKQYRAQASSHYLY